MPGAPPVKARIYAICKTWTWTVAKCMSTVSRAKPTTVSRHRALSWVKTTTVNRVKTTNVSRAKTTTQSTSKNKSRTKASLRTEAGLRTMAVMKRGTNGVRRRTEARPRATTNGAMRGMSGAL